MQRGEKKDFKPEKLKVGEFAVPMDTGEVYIKTGEATTKGIATLDSSGKLEQMPTHSDVGASAKGHKHSADDITSGVLPIENGGTDIYNAQNNLGLLKRYPDFSHLTLPETLRDVRDIFRLMENNSYIEITVGSNVSSKIQAICPVASGCLKIVQFYNQYTGYAEFHSNPISENSKWVGSLHNDRGFVWNKVYTSNCIIPIENGGTGATTTDQALTNLGAAPSNHAHSASDITSGTMPIENGGTGATTESGAVSNLNTAIVDLIYPVGSILMSVKSTNSSTYLGGTWVSWGSGQGPVDLTTSDSSFSSVEKTGGEKSHTLTINEMPSHAHKIIGGCVQGLVPTATGAFLPSVFTSLDPDQHIASTGGSQAHNNLPPYITCYMWKRTT